MTLKIFRLQNYLFNFNFIYIMAKKQKLAQNADLVGKCIGIFLYNLQLFGEFKHLEAKDLKLREQMPDHAQKCEVHVLTISTPVLSDGRYFQAIFHLSELGIISFLIASLMSNSNTNENESK